MLTFDEFCASTVEVAQESACIMDFDMLICPLTHQYNVYPKSSIQTDSLDTFKEEKC